MAAQLGRPWSFWVAGVVILLVSLSRMVLGVYFLSDVLVGLGLLAGFWLSRTVFDARTNWAGRVLVAVLGPTLVFAVCFVFQVLPKDLRRSGLVAAIRSAAVVLTATELILRLFRRLLRRVDPMRL